MSDRVFRLLEAPYDLLPFRRTKRYALVKNGMPVVKIDGSVCVRESAVLEWLRSRETVWSEGGSGGGWVAGTGVNARRLREAGEPGGVVRSGPVPAEETCL